MNLLAQRLPRLGRRPGGIAGADPARCSGGVPARGRRASRASERQEGRRYGRLQEFPSLHSSFSARAGPRRRFSSPTLLVDRYRSASRYAVFGARSVDQPVTDVPIAPSNKPMSCRLPSAAIGRSLGGAEPLESILSSWRPSMRPAATVAGLTLLLVSTASELRSQPAPLVGTWRVVQFCDQDSTGASVEPLGPNPTGYFIYTSTGQLSIQAMRTPPAG